MYALPLEKIFPGFFKFKVQEKIKIVEPSKFELQPQNVTIVFPQEKDVIAFAKANYDPELYTHRFFGKIIKRCRPSNFLKGEHNVHIYKLSGNPTSQECVKFAKSKKEILPNWYGLAVVHMMADFILPNIRFVDKILGFDKKSFLPDYYKGNKKMVPLLRGIFPTGFELYWDMWGEHATEKEVYMVTFSKHKN